MVLAQNSKVPCFILIFSIQSSMVILVLRPFWMVTCYQTWYQVWRASFIQPPDCSCWCPYFVCRKQMWHLGTRDGSFPGRNHGHHLYSTPEGLGDGAPLRNGNWPTDASSEHGHTKCPCSNVLSRNILQKWWIFPVDHLYKDYKVVKQWNLPSIWWVASGYST